MPCLMVEGCSNCFNMVSKVCLLVFVLAVGNVWGGLVFYRDPDARPLAAMSELTARLAAHAPDARLPLPTPQDFEAIKKVAQILIMLGQQVIPTIIGDPPSASTSSCDAPNDDVSSDVTNT